MHDLTIQNLILITGSAKSGKSEFAESLAQEQLKKDSNKKIFYIATMSDLPADPEMVEKIKAHKNRRPDTWTTFEVTEEIHRVISKLPGNSICLIDCLSLYISNMLLSEKTDVNNIHQKILDLLTAINSRSDITFFLVTNEVGWGIVPDNLLARTYRDVLGKVNQVMAQKALEVWLICVGLPLKLK